MSLIEIDSRKQPIIDAYFIIHFVNVNFLMRRFINRIENWSGILNRIGIAWIHSVEAVDEL